MEQFQKIIWEYYQKHRRRFPWRKTTNPYKILVSEIMLQQTQTARVVPKYFDFLKKFPTIKHLAKSPNSEVLKVWQGLGYNRRALNLKKTAELLVEEYGGTVPEDSILLQTFPGIGKATAASIIVFSYNKPLPFIETNIRRVFIHHFFEGQENVDDKKIMPLVEESLDRENPREWFYALMDYGVMLAQKENANVRSKHYKKQSRFEGSSRQMRGNVLRLLTVHQPLSYQKLEELVGEDPRLPKVMDELYTEGFIEQNEKEDWQIRDE